MKDVRYLLFSALALALCWGGASTARAQPPYQGTQPASQLVLPAGSWISVRVNNELSSDQNRVGDIFTAYLDQPLVVNGLVIARRGQLTGGRVAEAQKAGRRSGTSGLGLELTEISLVDGQQLPVRTQLIEYVGPTSVGQDVTTIATTSGIGAAIGALADGGRGAGIGALAGAAASTIGVLVTRGKPTVIYPESVITFRTLQPLTIYTAQSAPTFQPVRQEDYRQPGLQRRFGPLPAPEPRGGYYRKYPHIYSYPFPRLYYGPRFYFYSGPRFYRPGGVRVIIRSRPHHFHGRRFHRHR